MKNCNNSSDNTYKTLYTISLNMGDIPKYGIVFSGGGARALMHLGVLESLLNENITPKVVAGASMGALVGAFYASGYKPKEILSIVISERIQKYFNILFLRKGFREQKLLKELLNKYLKIDSFDRLKYELYISVTNLNSGSNEIRHEGRMFDYLIASASFPLIFKPKLINGQYYVDGGVTNNFPANALMGKCEKIIGVHTNHIAKKDDIAGVMQLMERLYRISIYNTVRSKEGLCDYYIDPPEARNYDTFDFSKINEIYSLGLEQGKKLAKKIHADNTQIS